jgi:hypothetical protein
LDASHQAASWASLQGMTLNPTTLQQRTTSDSPTLLQPGDALEDDPFYFINGLDDCQAGNIDMELDFLLAQDYNMEGNTSDTITWQQWDSWLADSNAMRPLSS